MSASPEEIRDELFEHVRLSVDPGQEPVRLDKYLSTHLEQTSRSRIQQAVKAGYVEVDGVPAKANQLLRPGQLIRLMMPYEKRSVDLEAEDILLDIVYEDEDVLVINKAAGMVVHPGNGHFTGTLLSAVAWHLGLRGKVETEDGRMGMLVHRIDMDTSGLLVLAKTPRAQIHLGRQFFDHSIERAYNALVWGRLPETEGTVSGNIGRDPNDRLRFRVEKDPEKGKWAVTHWRVLEDLGFVSLVECRLETGRTHQIRVHMSSLGHPLFGDARYGGTEIRKGTIYAKYRQFIENCLKICPRQALHARTLGFVHPVSGEMMRFEAPLPADMAALLERWRNYVSSLRTEDS